MFALQQEQDHEVEALYASLNTPRPVLVVLSGPSGVGKDSVIQGLKESGYPFYFVVTATTRDRRPGEEDLVHYEFMLRDEFVEKNEQGYFVESATVYGPGNLYGVPKHQITSKIAAGINPLIKIDVQGAATLKQKIPQSVSIFLVPESIQSLHDRLRSRNADDYAAVQRRLKAATQELDHFPGFDYVVINRTGMLDETVEQIRSIIVAERLRNSPLAPPRL